jgi:hypothetical protein
MTLPDADAFFVTEDGENFIATANARGPWSPDACHGGPPTALVVRAAELAAPDMQLARINHDIQRPIPLTGFKIESEILRMGRSVAKIGIRLTVDGKLHSIADAILLRRAPDRPEIKTASVASPQIAEAVVGRFPVKLKPSGYTFFGDALDVKYAPGSDGEPSGPTTVWMRTNVPILEDETPSGFQSISPLSDCSNGISPNQPFTEVTALNPDLSLAFHREPRGDWFAMESVTHAHPNGIGATEARLFDIDGPVGLASQTLLLNPGW